jgi:hypothetical protein
VNDRPCLLRSYERPIVLASVSGSRSRSRSRTITRLHGISLVMSRRDTYHIPAVNENTGNCLLEISETLKIHPWFATDKLKAFNSRDGTYPTPTDSKVAEEEEYEVEKVLEHDEEKHAYSIKWKGYPPEDTAGNRLRTSRTRQRKYVTSGVYTAPTDQYTKLAGCHRVVPDIGCE